MNTISFVEQLALALSISRYGSRHFECTLLDIDYDIMKITHKSYLIEEHDNFIVILAYGYNMKFNKQNVISILKS